jgi:hypothetical protein
MSLRRTARSIIVASTSLLALAACHDLTGRTDLPAGTISPSAYNTAAGAEALRVGAIVALQNALPSYIGETGLLTDELRTSEITDYEGTPLSASIDARAIPSTGVSSYAQLQTVRADASLALQALAAYDTTRDAPRLRAELFALSGYVHILLADFFCSGIPLSTIDLHSDFTYHAGSTTAEVYRTAIENLDSALALAGTATQVVNLARVLKARALLDLDSVSAAGQVSAAVPVTFRYQLALQWTGGATAQNTLNSRGTIADHEGQNGLPYLSSNDPRTEAVPANYQDGDLQLLFPAKYNQTGFSAFSVADGIEARLIQAEAALRANATSSEWLTILNALRTGGFVTQSADTIADTLGITGCGPDAAHWCTEDGVTNGRFVVPTGYTLAPALGFTIQPVGGALSNACINYSYYTPCYSADGSAEVRVYIRPAGVTAVAGTGGVTGLAPLSDPGTPAGRVALLFQERAYWLFLTGHREGDLRRLLRQYPQWFPNQSSVYPTGSYMAVHRYAPAGYGNDVNAPIDPKPEAPNAHFHGCVSRDP